MRWSDRPVLRMKRRTSRAASGLPAAAAQARGYVFHPTQVLEDEPDGSLTVRFKAAGHLEMAWHLYQWGDCVEVLAPDRLRAMVAGYLRSDFAALP